MPANELVNTGLYLKELFLHSLFSDANLVSYYRMESGALTTDSKGSNTLTNNGTVADGTGKFGGGADQGASNTTKYFNRADALGITNATDYTVSFWTKLNTEIASGLYVFFNINFPTAHYCQLYYAYNAGTRRLILDHGGSTVTYNITMGTTNWYHLVMTRSGSTNYLYINGVLAVSGAIASAGGGGNKFGIGSDHDGANKCSNVFDDVAIFNRALTASEVSQLYGAIAYYKLEDVNDSKGTKTLTNNNTVTFTTGQFNNGANFGTTNTNKSLSVASTFGLTSAGDKSISAWVKMNTELSGADSFGDFVTLTHADIDIIWRIGYWRQSSVNSFVINRGKNGIGTTPISTNTNLGTSNWHHVAFTWNGTTLTAYLDGSSIGTDTPSGNGNNGLSDEFRIGADTGASNFISATVDDVSIYSRQLTSTEIASIYSGNFSASPSLSPSVSPSLSASLSESRSLSRSPSLSPSPSASISASPSRSPSVSESRSESRSSSKSPSPSSSISASPSSSFSLSPSLSESRSISLSPSPSSSVSPSSSASSSPSASVSNSPSASESRSPSSSFSASISLSPSVSESRSPSVSPSASPSASESRSPSSSQSPSSSISASPSLSLSLSPSASESRSPSVSESRSASLSPSSSVSLSESRSESRSISNSPSSSPSPSSSVIPWHDASRLVVNTGSVESGVLSDTYTVGSGQLVLNEVTGAPGFDYEFWFGEEEAIPSTALHILFFGRYDGQNSHNIKISQWNFNTAGWTNLTANTTDFPDSVSNELHEFILIDNANYISGGVMRFRILHSSNGNQNHNFYVDELHLEYPGSNSPSPSLSASSSVSPSSSASLSPSASSSLSASLSPSASASQSPSASLSLSPSLSLSASPSPTPSESPSLSQSPSSSESASPSLSASLSPSASFSQSPSASESPSPSLSASDSISFSPSTSESLSASLSESGSPSTSPSSSESRSPSGSPSSSESASTSPSATESPSPSSSQSPSSSFSASVSLSPSLSMSESPSLSPSASPSPAEYDDKYQTVGNAYDDKYSTSNNTFEDKYQDTPNSSWQDKYKNWR